MKNIIYDFVDFDGIESLELLGRSLGGVLQKNTLHFDNDVAKGELTLSIPETGIWIRKWKLISLQHVILNKLPAPVDSEKKILLIYFLNPSLFSLKNEPQKVNLTNTHNSLFLSSDTAMEFSVVPKQPFYVLDIAISTSLLYRHFYDADASFKEALIALVEKNMFPLLMAPCNVEEYKILRELEFAINAFREDILYIRSRAYCLIVNFFCKILNRNWSDVIPNVIHYEQIMRAEHMVMENVRKFPNILSIAQAVNMSSSSLLRQFKLVYKKGIHEYYVGKKMELAKKMILENGKSIKEMAEHFGYRRASAFIETFTKHHGYSPGTLKLNGS